MSTRAHEHPAEWRERERRGRGRGRGRGSYKAVQNGKCHLFHSFLFIVCQLPNDALQLVSLLPVIGGNPACYFNTRFIRNTHSLPTHLITRLHDKSFLHHFNNWTIISHHYLTNSNQSPTHTCLLHAHQTKLKSGSL